MKTNEYLEDLRKKTNEELSEELVAAKKELFNLRFQNATNQLENTGRTLQEFRLLSLKKKLTHKEEIHRGEKFKKNTYWKSYQR